MRTIPFCLLLLLSLSANAQKSTPHLEKLITIQFKNEKVELALERIENLAGFNFSYNPENIDGERKISLTLRSKSVREALSLIFSGEVEYREKGKYIILTKKKINDGDDAPKQIIITGYVVDAGTGQKISSATVIEKSTLSAANTNAYGYFSMKVVKPQFPMHIAAFKINYQDTAVTIPSKQAGALSLSLAPAGYGSSPKTTTPAPTPALRDTVRYPVLAAEPDISEGKIAALNVTDTIYAPWQCSFVPFVGTHGLLSGSVISEWSLNVLGGYTLGSQKAELGGLFNIVTGNVNGVQAAGVFNTVGGDVDAVQLGGVVNMNRGVTRGVQVAGVTNLNGQTHTGVLVAGVANITRETTNGVSLAGVLNFQNGHSYGPMVSGVANIAPCGVESAQVSGVINLSVVEVKGAQVAGVLNTSIGHVQGAQVAGVLNASIGKVGGAQVAGVLNVAERIDGAQVSAVLNLAKSVEGTQLGLLNICDSTSSVPVGFFSYVHSGFHSVEVSADETFLMNVAFRTGVRGFYNIFGAGINPPGTNEQTWYYAYGIGGSPKLGRKVDLDIQLTAHWINWNSTPEFNLLNRFYLGADYRILKGVSIFGGVQLNGLLTEIDTYFPSDIVPDDSDLLYDENLDETYNLKIYPGARAGLRFWW